MKRLTLGILLAGVACGPPERTVVIHPGERHVVEILDLLYQAQVTLPDLFVLRPDEYAGVAPDPARGLVYAAGREGRLLALAAVDGGVVWERDMGPGAVGSQPWLGADGSVLFLGTDNGELHAIDLEGHESRWSYATEGTIRAQPVVHEGVVYFTNSHQDVFALDARDGRWRWQYSREVLADVNTIASRAGLTVVSRASGNADEQEDAASAEGDAAVVVYTGFDDGKVVALGGKSGEPLWIATVAPAEGGPFVDCDSTPLFIAERDEVVVTGQETGVYGLAAEDGTPRWTFPVRGAGTVVHGTGNTLLFASSLEGVYAIDPGGSVRWRRQLDPGVLSTPLLVNDVVFVTHSEIGMFAFAAESGELLARVDTGSGMSSVPVHDPANRRLYALTNRGSLLAFRVNLRAAAG